MPVNVCNLIRNIGLKNEAENLLAILNKITTVLNVVQSDSTDMGTAVAHWLQLTEDESLPVHVRDSLKKRFEGATTSFHLIAYELTKADGDPNISQKQSEEALKVIKEIHGASFMPFFAGYTTKDYTLFAESVFDEHTKLVLSPTRYWRYAASRCQLPDAKKMPFHERHCFLPIKQRRIRASILFLWPCTHKVAKSLRNMFFYSVQIL